MCVCQAERALRAGAERRRHIGDGGGWRRPADRAACRRRPRVSSAARCADRSTAPCACAAMPNTSRCSAGCGSRACCRTPSNNTSRTAAAKPSSCVSSTAARRPPSACPAATSSLTLEALSPGSREVLRASVDYDNIGSNEDDRFNLVVQRVRTLGSEHIEDQEIFRRLSIEPGTTRFVCIALQESMLVRVRGAVPSRRPDRTFRPGARHPIGYVDSNPDGDDGVAAHRLRPDRLRRTRHRASSRCATSRTCISSAFRRRRAIATSGRACCSSPRSSAVSSRALLIVDPPAAWETCDEALQGLRELAFQSDHALTVLSAHSGVRSAARSLRDVRQQRGGRRHVRAHGLAPLTVGRRAATSKSCCGPARGRCVC